MAGHIHHIFYVTGGDEGPVARIVSEQGNDLAKAKAVYVHHDPQLGTVAAVARAGGSPLNSGKPVADDLVSPPMSDDEPKLAGRDLQAPAPDPYEAKYMSGPDGALYFAKIRAPRYFHLLFLLPLLVIIGSALVAHAPLLVPIFSALPLFLLWILFSALRISVTSKEVHVQYGLFGPRIPIEAIESCEACEYDWKQYGGWGIRYGRDGSVAYNMLGDAGRAVRITYKKGTKTKKVLLAARDPERLATAIQQARAMALTGGALPRFEEAADPLRIEALADAEAPRHEAEEEAPPISEKRLR